MNYIWTLIVFCCIILNITRLLAQVENADSECGDLDLFGDVPFNDIVSSIQTVIRSEREMPSLSEILQSPQFEKITDAIIKAAAYRRTLGFLRGIGSHVGQVVDRVGRSMGSEGQDSTGTVVQDLFNMIPTDKVLRCLNFRFNTEPVFKTLLDGIGSPEFKNLVEHFQNSDRITPIRSLQSNVQDRRDQISGIINQGLNFLRVPPG